MKFVKLLHNPGAGDGDHSVEELVEIIEAAGFECDCASVKKIKRPVVHSPHIDLVALAGGDGTIRKAAKKLLEEDVPIGLFPMGTANNIARTLRIPSDPGQVVNAWKGGRVVGFDIGTIRGLGDDELFFLEGFGYGVFPLLMDAMESQDKKREENREQKLKSALDMLHDIVSLAAPSRCQITVDGKDYSGDFLLAEVMNIQSIGPNLKLSPVSQPDDGRFEVVLITEDHRWDLLDYLSAKVDGKEHKTFFPIISGRNIDILWEGTTFHIDDEYRTSEKPVKVNIRLQPNAFKFIVP